MRLFVVEFAYGAHHFLGVLDEISSLQSTQSLQLERVSGQDLATAFAAAKLEREMSSSFAAKPKISSRAPRACAGLLTAGGRPALAPLA